MERRVRAGVGSLLVAIAYAAGCAISNYPVITDSRGADGDGILTGQCERAYIIPTLTGAVIWDDGSDQLFATVAQAWTGDQWIYNYDNHDPTASVIFLDQMYCDPVFAEACSPYVAWNPALPDWPDRWSEAPEGYDDPFDYIPHPECSGFQAMEVLLSQDSRIGECGSGLFADEQALAYEFSRLARSSWRGEPAYLLPLDDSIMAVNWTDASGEVIHMPLYGRFNLTLDERMRVVFPVPPNARQQLLWIRNWTAAHGPYATIDITYGSLSVQYQVKVVSVDGALDRL